MLRVCFDLRGLPADAVNGTSVYAAELRRHVQGVCDAAPYDVLHRPAQFNAPELLQGWLEAPAPKVITCLDLIAYHTPSLFPSDDAHRRYTELQRASLSAATEVITISQHARREIIDAFGLSGDRVHAIALAVDRAFFATPAPPPRQRPYFLYCGTDYLHKNLHALLRGYAWLRAKWPDAPDLVLTGPRSGAESGVYIWGKALAPGVEYLGLVPREQLPALYQHATAFVYPSTYEGFGLPLLEAMAAGTPVVASPLTSIPEVAGDAALYLRDFSLDDFAQALRAVATDEALRRKLIEAGRMRVQQFDWAETARRTAEVYARARSGVKAAP